MYVVLIILFSVFAFVKIHQYNNFHRRQEVMQQNALTAFYEHQLQEASRKNSEVSCIIHELLIRCASMYVDHTC